MSAIKSLLNIHNLPAPDRTFRLQKGPGKGREGARWDVLMENGRRWVFTVILQLKNPPLWSFKTHGYHYSWDFSEVSDDPPEEFTEHLQEALERKSTSAP